MLGILGTGQLSLMLAEAAARLGLETLALGQSADDPAAQAVKEIVTGRLGDEAALARFFSRARTVVFENEFVDCDALSRSGAPFGVRFEPSLAAIGELQDKIRQKRLLERLGIPAAAWIPRDDGEGVSAFLRRAEGRFLGGFVLKWARMGYDGKGVLVVGGATPAGTEARPETFCAEAERLGIPVFAEEKIAFRRELAMVAAFSTRGELARYPLVVSRQTDGICRTVQGPATALGVAESLEREAGRHMEKLARGISLHGSFALEFFETEKGELRVNEIAPRVHNSGHYTQDCAATSQFENHWRAVLGMPLGDTACAAGFVMVNLIGPRGVSLSATAATLPQPDGTGILHWYGKGEIRPGRKLGHLNARAASGNQIGPLVNALEERRLKWESQLIQLAKGRQV